MALLAAGVLAPVSLPVLPGSAAHRGGDAAVLAQTSVEAGTPDPCPASPPGFRVDPLDDSQCVLTAPACPVSPVSGAIMLSSVDDAVHPAISELLTVGSNANTPVPLYRYPHFCEERILAPANAAGYTQCTALTGFITMTHVMAWQTDTAGDPLVDAGGNPVIDPGGIPGLDAGGNPVTANMCRLLSQPQCAGTLYRSDANECRAVTRRTWSCPPNTRPRNEFNTCYRPQAHSATVHPACAPGAPDMAVLDCEDYVGDDYARNPASLDCTTDFDTGTTGTALSANTLSGSGAVHWCEFDASNLKVVCHGANPPPSECAPTAARCLKRASDTGGCSAVAATIRCRAEQAALTAGTRTAEQVQEAGCRPCVVLPFSPPGPDCPAEYRSDPNRAGGQRRTYFDTLHRVEQSLAVADYDCRHVLNGADLSSHPRCAAERVCDGEVPQAQLTWTSGHGSGLAIVNAPVVLTIEGLPRGIEDRVLGEFRIRQTRFEIEKEDLNFYTEEYRAFDNDVFGDRIIRIWPQTDFSKTYSQVSEYALDRGAPCLLEAAPDFVATIRELRPDVPEQRGEIERLFGSSSLAWWDDLPTAEQRRRTERLGLTFYADLTNDADRERELADRAAELDETVPCNFGATVWCRWEPGRAGYFTVTGAGAWLLIRQRSAASWFLSGTIYSGYVYKLSEYLSLQSAHVISSLTSIGSSSTSIGSKLAAVGLKCMQKPDLTCMPGTVSLDTSEVFAWNPNGKRRYEDDEWLYTDQADPTFRCPSANLRIPGCGGKDDRVTVGHYTTTEPIGIEVHEIRVTARTPDL